MSRTPRGDSKPTIWRRVGSRLYRRKATLAVLAGCALLLWHVLACVESPMAFSPEGDLAFTTVGPGSVPSDEEAADSATAEEVMRSVGTEVDLIIDSGPSEQPVPSTVSTVRPMSRG